MAPTFELDWWEGGGESSVNQNYGEADGERDGGSVGEAKFKASLNPGEWHHGDPDDDYDDFGDMPSKHTTYYQQDCLDLTEFCLPYMIPYKLHPNEVPTRTKAPNPKKE